MTFVGKVLVVLNVVLTVCVAAFAGGVYAFQTNWRDKYNEAQVSMELKDKANDEQVARLKDTLKDKDLEVAAADEKAQKIQEVHGEMVVKYNGVKATLEEKTKEFTNFEKSNDLLSEENKINLALVGQYRGFLKDLHTNLDTLTAKIAKLEDEKYGMIVEKAQIIRKHNSLLQHADQLSRFIAANKLIFDPNKVAIGEAPATPSSGLVLKTLQGNRNSTTLVQITVGKDDGIRVGQILIVYRLEGKGKYLGKIEIVSITADRAVGQVVEDAKKGKIKEGDHVSSNI
jgi:hypothetical protein